MDGRVVGAPPLRENVVVSGQEMARKRDGRAVFTVLRDFEAFVFPTNRDRCARLSLKVFEIEI